ncbi:hypothetical protein [Azospirillum picis]|uniref:Uncharacterized protein n=1 Tax=Azospirillum picis TaxID=488438 RepID=A0ABU0MRX7_9PROT|nr:hypothetical protein [Azospirillum picis]MBP2302515.1 hypothetical protein [Azospirillum picis]MDQ0536243.1 hypothetical protein [Azospirillum picis]
MTTNTTLIRGIVGLDSWTSQFTFAPAVGANWSPDRPVTNLGGMPLYRVGETLTGSQADTVFVATSPTPRPVGLLAFIGHNSVHDDDTFDVEFFGDEDLEVPVHQIMGEEFWPTVYDRASLPIEHESFWTGKYTLRQKQRKRVPIRPVWIPQPVMCKGIRVTVHKFDPTTGPFRCRMFEIALGYQFSINPEFGMQYGLRFRTTSVEAVSGHKEFDRLPAPQTWKGTLKYLPQDEARQRMYDALEDNDLNTPFLFFPFPSRKIDWLRMVSFVRNTDPGLYSIVAARHDEVPFAYEGVL